MMPVRGTAGDDDLMTVVRVRPADSDAGLRVSPSSYQEPLFYTFRLLPKVETCYWMWVP